MDKQKVGDSTSIYEEEVLFNSDTLSKIISYLPSVDLLNLALVSKRFGLSNINDGLSLIEKSANIAVQDIATEEQLAALPHYEGENSLANYHYLQFMRGPLTFDQLVGAAEYVGGDKSCAHHINAQGTWGTAFSNCILRAGKHYAIFEARNSLSMFSVMAGVMRPGQADQEARSNPLNEEFFEHFSRRSGNEEYNNNNKVHCCMYTAYNGEKCISDWTRTGIPLSDTFDGSESMASGDKIGLLLDLDEGSLSVYKNGRKLGVMMRGLAGSYCWVVSIHMGAQVTIKRGTIPRDSRLILGIRTFFSKSAFMSKRWVEVIPKQKC